MIIDGKTIAERLIGELKAKLAAHPIDKFVGALLVGEDPVSLNFLKQKEKVAKELNTDFRLYRLPLTTTTDELRHEISRYAGVKNCGGFLVQLPLPEHINKHYVLNTIPKEKDIDFLSETALGAFYTGRSKIMPPSAGTVEEILKLENYDLRTLSVVLIGAGFLIGKPVGFWLQNRVAELTIIDSGSPHLRAKLKEANIVISGAGGAGLFSVDDLREGALVIDFGFNSIKGKIAGDFNADGAEEKNISYTRTPGGTGPILVAKLYENFVKLNE